MFDDSDPKRSTETSQAIPSNPHDDGLIFAGFVLLHHVGACFSQPVHLFGTELRYVILYDVVCLHVEAYVALTPVQARLLVQQPEWNANI